MGTAEVVGGVVSPVHDSYGKNSLVPAKHRSSMVKLALQTSDWIRMSDWEIEQDQWTRTRLTLQYHQVFYRLYLLFDFINPVLLRHRDIVFIFILLFNHTVFVLDLY